MTDLPAPDGPTEYLRYNGYPVHFVLDEGAVWFAQDDLLAALGLGEDAKKRVDARRFPPRTRTTAPEYDDNGQEISSVTLLSPVGVWFLTHILGDWDFRLVSAWAKREAAVLCPDARKDDARMFLQLQEGNELPPRPNKYSGRQGEYHELRFSDAYIFRDRNYRPTSRRPVIARPGQIAA